MRIGLYNLEPKYKNLALEKVRCYYQAKGYEIEDYFALNRYDEVWASSIFDWTKKLNVPPNAKVGGSGFSLNTCLPPDIEEVKPHLNFGFTTRGCIRKCPFCIVPKKEGKIRVEGDLLDLWDGKAKDVKILDNNILALPEHFALICKQAQEHKLRLDFNQGLDHRLLTPEIVELLAIISHAEYHFSFDDPSFYPSVARAIEMLKDVGINRCIWYVLVGFNTTFSEDLARLNFLKEHKQNAFVQKYKKNNQFVPLARWANQHHIFHRMTWEQWLSRRENKSYCGLFDN